MSWKLILNSSYLIENVFVLYTIFIKIGRFPVKVLMFIFCRKRLFYKSKSIIFYELFSLLALTRESRLSYHSPWQLALPARDENIRSVAMPAAHGRESSLWAYNVLRGADSRDSAPPTDSPEVTDRGSRQSCSSPTFVLYQQTTSVTSSSDAHGMISPRVFTLAYLEAFL